MKSTTFLYAFLGGLLLGAGTALLFAPEKGTDTRDKIKSFLRRKGIICRDKEVDELVKQLTTDIDD